MSFYTIHNIMLINYLEHVSIILQYLDSNRAFLRINKESHKHFANGNVKESFRIEFFLISSENDRLNAGFQGPNSRLFDIVSFTVDRNVI